VISSEYAEITKLIYYITMMSLDEEKDESADILITSGKDPCMRKWDDMEGEMIDENILH